ncbi:glycogen debranching enzyme GlgX [Gloeothece citriformis PCC 7424]|uniref:Glycogen debranching enzyme GlgX n=1 Tax=Gloeothece citriformis (strain PCC 7424) TaxID=65393 RepID=B7KJ81_GLOC7|nr:glycogen debranching protein GlgX [Gloeothece citriformis]ACK72165.1 glycogen debranching enzyme GlgX [Gloeothece citriformis PCC 7424]
MILEISPGQSFPLGATVSSEGVNFCIFSKQAWTIELLLFDEPTSPEPSQIIKLDSTLHKTFFYWHVFVKGIKPGQVYAYRAYGPFAPEEGHRFDPQKVLLDPYAKAIVGEEIYDRQAARNPGDNCAKALRGVVIDTGTYDWEGDHPLRHPYASSVIYEMHVGGFTRNPNSGLPPEKRGTFAGIIEKIPYLKNLGITAVELMPIHYFDPEDARDGLTNYWGYTTIGFFAPHRAYSSRKDPYGPLDEFRDLVKALHRAGIEVILDVVFNHTAEGNETGPTLSFRGLDNETYYILDADDPALYANYTGCGNTFKANHPIVSHLILECLRYWVAEMHVDGFRFDLASILARDTFGNPIEDISIPAIIWAIESDPILAGTKLIAEAWDAAGLYHVGRFVELADWFSEWNGPFRDDVRRFVKGDENMVTRLAARILGSPDIYQRPNTNVNRSINFVTCHDGFTLNDLVSYNQKHNEANKEDNRDGANDNESWNCGKEGPTDDPNIEALRLRQIKNFLTILFLSQGTPMLLMGDEVRRTQRGNNNSYCQDNELSWFNWDEVNRQFDLWCFVRRLIHFTQGLKLFSQESLLKVSYSSFDPHLGWHGAKLGEPDWSNYSRSLAFSLRHPEAGEYLHVMLNAYWKPISFELPIIGRGECWHCVIDTTMSLPDAMCDLEAAIPVQDKHYLVEARSCVVLIVKPL